MTQAKRHIRVEGVALRPGVAYRLKPHLNGRLDYDEVDAPRDDASALALHYVGTVGLDRDGRSITLPLRWTVGSAQISMRVRFDAPAAGRFKDLCAHHVCEFQVAPDHRSADLLFRHPVTQHLAGKISMPAVMARPDDARAEIEPVSQRAARCAHV